MCSQLPKPGLGDLQGPEFAAVIRRCLASDVMKNLKPSTRNLLESLATAESNIALKA